MSEYVMRDAKILLGGYDMTGKSNSVTLNHTVEMLDRTVFGSSARKRLAGLRDFDLRLSGLWGSTSHDKDDYDRIGSSARVLTITPATSEGSVAYLANGVFSEYSVGGSVGELLAFDLAAIGTPAAGAEDSMYRGKLLCAVAATTEKGTTDATPINMGAATTSQRVYMTYHMVEDLTSSVSSGGLKGNITASCSSFGVGSTCTPLTVIQTSRTTAITGVFYSTKIGSTSKQWYRFNYETTSTAAGGYLSFFVGLAIK